MKKTIAALLAASMLIAAMPAMAEGEISVEVNGQAIDFAKYDNVLPYIESDYTLIPVRAIAESLGLTVDWNGETRTVTAKNDNTEITLVIDSAEATVNGEAKTLDIPARIMDDRTFIPLRFVSENMGAKVDWEEETRLITITTDDKPQIPEGGMPEGNMPEGGPQGGNGGGQRGNMGGNMGTVLNGGSGMEHMVSFNYGYKLTAARNWIFEQTKDNLKQQLRI